MHPTEVRARFSRRTLALWMASSLVMAGCGEPAAEASVEPYASESQSLDEGATNERRIIVYQTTSLQLYTVDKKGREVLLAQRSGVPMVSPDGTSVAYAKLPDTWNAGDPVEHAELHVFDSKSGKSERLTSGHDDAEPIWTPDGLTCCSSPPAARAWPRCGRSGWAVAAWSR